ncbi:MAG: FAD-dependent monooxygenase [Caulobacteraceae bacterium]
MKPDALIVGGGPAGAALATLLARAGEDTLLIEREAGAHDKVCGEFVSGEAAGYLHALGLDLPGLGAVPIHKVRLAARAEPVEAALPFPAFSLSRRRLDEALLGLAARAGVQVRRGVKARGLERSGAGWRADLDGGGIEAASAFLATGKHDLKGRRRPPGLHGSLVGFKLHLRLAPYPGLGPGRSRGAESVPRGLRWPGADRGRPGQPLPGGRTPTGGQERFSPAAGNDPRRLPAAGRAAHGRRTALAQAPGRRRHPLRSHRAAARRPLAARRPGGGDPVLRRRRPRHRPAQRPRGGGGLS